MKEAFWRRHHRAPRVRAESGCSGKREAAMAAARVRSTAGKELCTRRLRLPCREDPRRRWHLQSIHSSYRLCSTRATLENINKPVIDRIIRVDHAGEYGANRIYAGQIAVLGRTSVGPVIQHMWDQEKDHLNKFNELLVSYRVRPTILLPFWNVTGFLLGAGTALLGKEGAMACTVAVEESIAAHYNNQIRTLMEEDPEKYKGLLETIKKFRDEELEHHDTGLDHDAELAPAYSILKNVIQIGCKAAIFLSERI
ncbi:5-demethoxyubiquinone hydroxylase, mitochondrial [Hemicordylus capensis]|uniref:5-demethoxyubiquinone hydroxylase, mitochondrial n=1 Tax=Hemicordylus capensis TaxID=884348 RepID=UPI0023042A27|nr:5-demethoxyubiquinone hydroxylase, mitochondrial [Hemicordylus capensis]